MSSARLLQTGRAPLPYMSWLLAVRKLFDIFLAMYIFYFEIPSCMSLRSYIWFAAHWTKYIVIYGGE
jgi:hypothetical protein